MKSTFLVVVALAAAGCLTLVQQPASAATPATTAEFRAGGADAEVTPVRYRPYRGYYRSYYRPYYRYRRPYYRPYVYRPYVYPYYGYGYGYPYVVRSPYYFGYRYPGAHYRGYYRYARPRRYYRYGW